MNDTSSRVSGASGAAEQPDPCELAPSYITRAALFAPLDACHLESVLEVENGADELRVDLCLDPQTSGGLLAAVLPEHAEDLVRRLPGAAVVGRVTTGPAGAVRLVVTRLGSNSE